MTESARTEKDQKPPLDDKAKKKKRRQRKFIILGTVSFISLIIWYMLQPLQAGIDYGICRSFLETHVKYPTTINITKYDEYEISSKSIRIFYTYIDEYGGQRSDMIECILTPDPVNGYIAEDIKINRNSVGEEQVKLFNKAIPGIIMGQPDLTIPRPPRPNDLADLKRD